MRILLAPDKFKSSLSAAEVARAMQRGIEQADANHTIDLCPMADGGEGTVDALISATGGHFETRRVTGPLPEMKVDARFGILGKASSIAGGKSTAVIEMSAASGLSLLRPEDRDPMRTTTFGTGQLLMAAVELGVDRIILGIGGSATIDAGIGCAQACGLPVLLEGGEPVSPGEPLTGGDLDRVMFIKHGRGSPIEKIEILVAYDVTNPLLGPSGAAAVFGPQKGATPQQVDWLETHLHQLARRNDKLDIANMPGAGAAGGLGFGLAAFFGVLLRPGIDLVMDAVGFHGRLQNADLVITGEGRLDRQSLSGKTTIGVARVAKSAGIPCIAIVGSAEDDPANEFRAQGMSSIIPICNSPGDVQQSIESAAALIAAAIEKAIANIPK